MRILISFIFGVLLFVSGCGSPGVVEPTYIGEQKDVAPLESGKVMILVVVSPDQEIKGIYLSPQPSGQVYVRSERDKRFYSLVSNLNPNQEYVLNVRTQNGFAIDANKTNFDITVNGEKLTQTVDGGGPQEAGQKAYKLPPQVIKINAASMKPMDIAVRHLGATKIENSDVDTNVNIVLEESKLALVVQAYDEALEHLDAMKAFLEAQTGLTKMRESYRQQDLKQLEQRRENIAEQRESRQKELEAFRKTHNLDPQGDESSASSSGSSSSTSATGTPAAPRSQKDDMATTLPGQYHRVTQPFIEGLKGKWVDVQQHEGKWCFQWELEGTAAFPQTLYVGDEAWEGQWVTIGDRREHLLFFPTKITTP